MTELLMHNLTTHVRHECPWAYFDPDFYIAQCGEHGLAPPIGDSQFYIKHYLDIGRRRCMSPNPLFDELYYRKLYPEVAREIELGQWAAGFEHYARIGAKNGYSPIWYFDGNFYKCKYSDLTDENLRFGAFRDSYSHYLHVGITERRVSHWTIGALKEIQENFQFPESQAELTKMLKDGSILVNTFYPVIDYNWMKEKYDWGRTVRPDSFVRHYLLNVTTQRLSPSPYFDEAFYISNEPAVCSAVEDGVFSCGYEHFVLFGMKEWRAPFSGFDPLYYFNKNMPENGSSGPLLSPFSHFIRHRRTARLQISKPLGCREIEEESGKGIYERRCIINAMHLNSLEFTTKDKPPDVSVIIIARENYAQTANCIVSATYNSKVDLEFIVFDNGSKDETRNLPSINPRIKY